MKSVVCLGLLFGLVPAWALRQGPSSQAPNEERLHWLAVVPRSAAPVETAELLARGEALYATRCSICHGKWGEGDGVAAGWDCVSCHGPTGQGDGASVNDQMRDYPLVWKARREGRKGHDLLRDLGTTGIQTPIRVVGGELVGTRRLHDSTLELGPPEGPTIHSKWLTSFKSHSGKAILHKSPWELFSDFYERVQPKGEELWITDGRINEIWQSAYDDVRRPYIVQRWPDTFFEMHPTDASRRGIESGDYVEITNDDVLIQTAGFIGVKADDLSYTALEKAGKIRIGKGSCRGVALVTEGIRPGVVFANFLDPASPSNSLVHRVPDPMTNRYRFKLGKGIVRKTGESPYKRELTQMSFKPRDIV